MANNEYVVDGSTLRSPQDILAVAGGPFDREIHPTHIAIAQHGNLTLVFANAHEIHPAVLDAMSEVNADGKRTLRPAIAVGDDQHVHTMGVVAEFRFA